MNVDLSTDRASKAAEQIGNLFKGNHAMGGSTGVRKAIRVLLIDESILTLYGLKTFVSKSDHIEVVGIATTCGEALTAIETHRPNVVMLEVEVERRSGIELCKKIRDGYPHIGVLFFTAHDNKDLLRAAILAGAQGYLLKSAAADAVTKSIEIVATGQAIMDQHLTEHVITWVKARGAGPSAMGKGHLSRDDRRLLGYVASGKTNREIALELGVLPTAVATRLQRIYKRLRISRRSEAARYYVHLEMGVDQ
ncbi:MAG: response regulator transcription factor [Nitrospira sp.]|nr:response regulator transcription factor [Nitrospira sp.]